ncbi:hypothetical protein DPMN_159365 [Dreissena polymorpha]|uniref:Uncharacterized protein n=1 Tax=Dreissena polymorpha TaxID=45954 RepID=A0A9D4IQN2_DREPO|nr:hypothetical protein DPMN_159365 [Dreissena polymorpha]
MLENKIHRNAHNARQCTVIKQERVRKLDADEEQFLRKENGDCAKHDLMVCNKILRNGFLMYSKKCSKGNKQNSYTILLDCIDCPTAIEVMRYIMHVPTQKVYAVGQLLR